VNFDERPILVFWETTRACRLACLHCRAAATERALPGELTHAEGIELIEQVAAFGRPSPILVFTGGDCLMRPDLFELVENARGRGIPTALSPSVTPSLDEAAVERIAAAGVRAVSISIDGAGPAVHDAVRGVPGHFEDTVVAVRRLVAAGLTVQVNTTVMRDTVEDLPRLAAMLVELGAHIWEVFFLVHVGRGIDRRELSAAEHEDVCHFLYDASHHGFVVRTVEAPFFRRVAAARRAGGPPPRTLLYTRLSSGLQALVGGPDIPPAARTASTRDGKGIVFVAHDGQVYPAGFLPLALGSVRDRPLWEIYRNDERLRAIRAARFSGRCGRCEHADLCGGSRARAFAASGNLLGEDPACSWEPVSSPGTGPRPEARPEAGADPRPGPTAMAGTGQPERPPNQD
jgi:AdoMet-dependent heme synthase